MFLLLIPGGLLFLLLVVLTPKAVANNRRDVPLTIQRTGFGGFVVLTVMLVAFRPPGDWSGLFFAIGMFFLMGLGAWIGLKRADQRRPT